MQRGRGGRGPPAFSGRGGGRITSLGVSARDGEGGGRGGRGGRGGGRGGRGFRKTLNGNYMGNGRQQGEGSALAESTNAKVCCLVIHTTPQAPAGK